MTEAHTSAYSIHPGSTKMFLDLKTNYWWDGMKADIATFVARCDICQRVKAEHQKPAGLLQPLPIPDRKSTRLNSSHEWISYAVFCLKKKNKRHIKKYEYR